MTHLKRNALGGLVVPVLWIGAAARYNPDEKEKIEASVALKLNGQMTLQLVKVQRWTGRNLLGTGNWETVFKQ